MKRYIHAFQDPDKPWLVDYDLSKMTDEQWAEEERKRIQQETDDEADYYDREHGEGIYASKYYEDADTYVVKIWYETDPGHDTLGPVASEEIFFEVANSPDEAIENVKRAWTGPIDRIEVIDVNPEEDEYEYAEPYEDQSSEIVSYSVIISVPAPADDFLIEHVAWKAASEYVHVIDSQVDDNAVTVRYEDNPKIDPGLIESAINHALKRIGVTIIA